MADRSGYRKLNPGRRAAQRLPETTRRRLEGTLKRKMNAEKSRAVSVISIQNFKFPNFALEKGKAKLKELTSRLSGRNVRGVMRKIKVHIRVWPGYFGIASMKTTIRDWDGWLRRFRCYIWKQWKHPRTRVKSLVKLGMPQWQAYRNGNSQKGY